jgi:hypothetical protein
VTASTRALTLEAIVPNPTGRLKPGFFATARIEEAEKRPGILVPSAAVRTVAGTARVFVIATDRAEERVVMTGQAVGDQIEIVSGLKAGERLAATAVNQLVGGIRIAVSNSHAVAGGSLRHRSCRVLVLSLTVVGLLFGQLGVDRRTWMCRPSRTTRLPGRA